GHAGAAPGRESGAASARTAHGARLQRGGRDRRVRIFTDARRELPRRAASRGGDRLRGRFPRSRRKRAVYLRADKDQISRREAGGRARRAGRGGAAARCPGPGAAPTVVAPRLVLFVAGALLALFLMAARSCV